MSRFLARVYGCTGSPEVVQEALANLKSYVPNKSSSVNFIFSWIISCKQPRQFWSSFMIIKWSRWLNIQNIYFNTNVRVASKPRWITDLSISTTLPFLLGRWRRSVGWPVSQGSDRWHHLTIECWPAPNGNNLFPSSHLLVMIKIIMTWSGVFAFCMIFQFYTYYA